METFVSMLDGVRRQPSGIAARCPAHDDHVQSLSVNEGEHGGIVVKCHAGCATKDVVAALGLTMADLSGEPRVVAEYVYIDAKDQPLWTIEKWINPKTFRCVPGLPPEAQRVLYREDVCRWAREYGAHIYYVEGEKDVDRLIEMGLAATTNVGGAGKWLDHYAEQLRGTHVYVVADNDGPGVAHARQVAAGLEGKALSVTLLHTRHGKDISEALDAGWTLTDLEPLPEGDGLGSLAGNNVVVRPVVWGWPGYIPLGKVTAIEGDPGDGKSILTVDLAARFTSGAPMPDGSKHCGPFPVILISAEDDVEDTVAPRLLAAGADLRLIRFVTHGATESVPFVIGPDMAALQRMVIDIGAKLVILDPLSAFLGAGTDSHNDAGVRQALWPLYRMARDTGCGVLVVRHLNKGSGKAIYRGGGSIAFAGAARAVFTVGRDPEDRNRRVFACTKMNIGPEPPSMAYSISYGNRGPYLEWHGVVDTTSQDIVDGNDSSLNSEVIQFLNTVVENGEPMTWRDIVKAGRDEGYTEGQLRMRRTRSRLIKIYGTTGNRSARWGYLHHELAAKDAVTHLQGEEGHLHHLLTFGDSECAQTGTGPDPTISIFCSENAESGASGGRAANGVEVDEEAEEERRIDELEALPLVCQTCSTSELVSRFGHPYWVVRCVNHNPFTYGGTNAKE